jgi:predicted transglutaminase-like cysteine proteinase
MMKKMTTVSCQELARKKEELATRLGPRLHPDGFAEFSQLVDKACTLQDTDQANSLRLVQKAAEMLPQVERSVENALSIRDQIRAKMLEYAEEGMDRYTEALKELAK